MARKKRVSKKQPIYNDKVQNHQDNLAYLSVKKKEIEDDIDRLAKEFETKCLPLKDAAKWLESLPIESLKELGEFDRGRIEKFSLADIKIRNDIKKENDRALKQLDIVNKEISQENIELLQAKIDSILE